MGSITDSKRGSTIDSTMGSTMGSTLGCTLGFSADVVLLLFLSGLADPAKHKLLSSLWRKTTVVLKLVLVVVDNFQSNVSYDILLF